MTSDMETDACRGVQCRPFVEYQQLGELRARSTKSTSPKPQPRRMPVMAIHILIFRVCRPTANTLIMPRTAAASKMINSPPKINEMKLV